MGLLSWLAGGSGAGAQNVRIQIEEVEPLIEPSGEVRGCVKVVTGGRAVVGLKARLISVVAEEDPQPDVTPEVHVHGQMNELLQAAFEDGGEQQIEFSFPYDLHDWAEQQGWLLETARKLAQMALHAIAGGGDKPQSFYLEVQSSINGEWEPASDRKAVQVVLPES